LRITAQQHLAVIFQPSFLKLRISLVRSNILLMRSAVCPKLQTQANGNNLITD
jgi:hypothetical protein